jgi:hypothetical protein
MHAGMRQQSRHIRRHTSFLFGALYSTRPNKTKQAPLAGAPDMMGAEVGKTEQKQIPYYLCSLPEFCRPITESNN